jgi:hypothetical protein
MSSGYPLNVGYNYIELIFNVFVSAFKDYL